MNKIQSYSTFGRHQKTSQQLSDNFWNFAQDSGRSKSTTKKKKKKSNSNFTQKAIKHLKKLHEHPLLMNSFQVSEEPNSRHQYSHAIDTVKGQSSVVSLHNEKPPLPLRRIQGNFQQQEEDKENSHQFQMSESLKNSSSKRQLPQKSKTQLEESEQNDIVSTVEEQQIKQQRIQKHMDTYFKKIGTFKQIQKSKDKQQVQSIVQNNQIQQDSTQRGIKKQNNKKQQFYDEEAIQQKSFTQRQKQRSHLPKINYNKEEELNTLMGDMRKEKKRITGLDRQYQRNVKKNDLGYKKLQQMMNVLTHQNEHVEDDDQNPVFSQNYM